MIGIISKDTQRWAVYEFFELFKTPWEFYDPSRCYDVVIVADPDTEIPAAKLALVFDKAHGSFADGGHAPDGTVVLSSGQTEFPVFTGCAFFPAGDRNLLQVKGLDLQACLENSREGRRVLTVGYDIFDELEFILSHGQPVKFAQIPTVDIHISLIRNWIIETGIPLIEIPPVPYRYAFTACLTHDVDFLQIKDHLLDRSMMGYLLRSILPLGTKGLARKQRVQRQIKNWKALATLPAVLAGRARDFWLDVDRYMSIEGGLPATYFFIPFRGHPGESDSIKPPRYRAAKYDIDRHKDVIAALVRNGNEIGLHGIDAWLHSRNATREREAIKKVAGCDCNGIRMHWLYFSEKSPAALEGAGLKYDSSLGFNETVGFKSGTTQVFRLPKSELLELPMNIMDTALFSRGRLALSEKEALRLCESVLRQIPVYGGAVTVNWHTRSLSPERNWDEFYTTLLHSVKKRKPWFASGKQAVDWFSGRRTLQFDHVKLSGNKLEICLSSVLEQNDFPPPVLRIHHPKPEGNSRPIMPTDLPLNGRYKYEVEL